MPMYQVQPASGGAVQVDLPSCMYALPNIHAQGHVLLQNGGEVGVDPAVLALERRQEEILRRLYQLKAAVDGLAKAAATPDADLDLSQDGPPPPGPPRTPAAPPTTTTTTAAADATDLDSLLGKDLGALRDIVIAAPPSRPPLSLLVLHGLLCRRYRVLSAVHVHSSAPPVPPPLLACLGRPHAHGHARQAFQLGFTLIWKDVPKVQMKFSVRSMCPIEGEANIARFLSRLLCLNPGNDIAAATQVDSWVDSAFFQLAEGGARERASALRCLDTALAKGGGGAWLGGAGAELSLADIACYCCLRQAGLGSAPSAGPAPPANVIRWLQACDNLELFGPAHLLG